MYHRKIYLSEPRFGRAGKYVNVSALELKENTQKEIYLERVSFHLLLIKQVFKDADGVEDVLYLVAI
ncbi:MAG: hypothetical protein WC557_12270 [Ignavibacteriaceae bacterium]